MKNRHLIDQIRLVIRETDANADAWLFGSRARGDSRADSDWDVLILVENKAITNEIEDKFRGPLYDLELETGEIISTFIYPKKIWNRNLVFSPLYKNIKKEGIRL
jgi:uncharacterized protein